MKLIFVISSVILLASCKHQQRHCVEGNCVDGIGKRVYDDGGFEQGRWVNEKLNGPGIQFFGSKSDFAGDSYKGDFVDD